VVHAGDNRMDGHEDVDVNVANRVVVANHVVDVVAADNKVHPKAKEQCVDDGMDREDRVTCVGVDSDDADGDADGDGDVDGDVDCDLGWGGNYSKKEEMNVDVDVEGDRHVVVVVDVAVADQHQHTHQHQGSW